MPTEGIWEYTVSGGKATITNCTGSGNLTTPTSLGGYPVEIIGAMSMWYKDSISSIIISEGIKTIESYAFYDTHNMISVTLPTSLLSIGFSAFANTSSLHSINIPGTVSSIDRGAFSFSGISSLTIGTGVTSIPNEFVMGATNLSTVSMPNSVTFIDQRAFKGCTNLYSITIGTGVSSIGEQAFALCSHLQNIYFLGLVAPITVGINWVQNTSSSIRGHAYSNSNFPHPGQYFHGLLMGDYIDTNNFASITATLNGDYVDFTITYTSDVNYHYQVKIWKIPGKGSYSLYSVTEGLPTFLRDSSVMYPYTRQYYKFYLVRSDESLIDQYDLDFYYPPPRPVRDLSISQYGTDIKMTWSYDSGTINPTVEIYRKNVDGSYSKIDEISGEETQYYDRNLDNDRSYEYSLKSKGTYGTDSYATTESIIFNKPLPQIEFGAGGQSLMHDIYTFHNQYVEERNYMSFILWNSSKTDASERPSMDGLIASLQADGYFKTKNILPFLTNTYNIGEIINRWNKINSNRNIAETTVSGNLSLWNGK